MIRRILRFAAPSGRSSYDSRLRPWLYDVSGGAVSDLPALSCLSITGVTRALPEREGAPCRMLLFRTQALTEGGGLTLHALGQFALVILKFALQPRVGNGEDFNG